MILNSNKPIEKRHYLMAQKNEIDLKYLWIPEIEITEEFLKQLPYSNAKKEYDAKSLSNDAMQYHHDRTEKNQAHRIKERGERKKQRDSDPFYWLAIYIKTQKQFKTILGQNYARNGIAVINNRTKLNELLVLMDSSFTNFKKCVSVEPYVRHIKFNEQPTLLQVNNVKLVEPNRSSNEIENKYGAFCHKHGIDMVLVTETKVFDKSGNMYDDKYIDKVFKDLDSDVEKLRKEANKYSYGDYKHYDIYMRSQIAFNEFCGKISKDSTNTFAYYRKFCVARRSLRQVIGRLMTAELSGELTDAQLKQLRTAVSNADSAYRDVILSEHYVVGFAISGMKQVETINYNVNGKTADMTNLNNSLEKDGDAALLLLHNQAKDIQRDIEEARRKKETVKARRKEIEELRRSLVAEEEALTNEEMMLDEQMTNLAVQYDALNEKINKRK